MNRVWNIALHAVAVVAILVTLGFVDGQQADHNCTGVEINVNRATGNFFVEEEEVDELIRNLYPVDSTKVRSFDLLALENRLNANASIRNVEVYTTVDGKLRVDVEQRMPILRVFTTSGDSYYIDQEGWLMPLSRKFTSRVLVANGVLDGQFDSHYQYNVATYSTEMDSLPELVKLNTLYQLASRLSEDPFWKAQINQVYLDEQGEIEMIPRVGNHRIILGGLTNLDRKLDKLMVFYKKGLVKTGWNNYSVINLKFKNQVVCTKK